VVLDAPSYFAIQPHELMWFTSYGCRVGGLGKMGHQLGKEGNLCPPIYQPLCILVSWHQRIKENMHYKCYNNS
jgi:hypothetical protein